MNFVGGKQKQEQILLPQAAQERARWVGMTLECAWRSGKRQ